MKISKGRILLIVLFLLTSTIGYQFVKPPQSLALHVLDVGQGDSILIVTPNNKTMLIDTGENEYSDGVLAYLKSQNISRIDWLVGTHPHSDHIGGMGKVIENFEVGEIFLPPIIHNSKTFESLLQTIEKKNLSITPGKAGISLEVTKDLSIDFLGPLEDYGDDLNNWSIVLQMRYKEKSFIFTGDIEGQAEEDLLNAYPPHQLKSHFIKIPHHGSSSSTSKEFLMAINPDVAVISVGKDNSYGHPHKTTLQLLQDSHIKLYRTDLQRNVIFYSDGERIWATAPPLK